MSDYIKNYDIIDIFDENDYQTVHMAISNQNYQDIVIINKLNQSEWIDDDFIKHYKKITDNLITIDETEENYTVINKYEQSKLLSDYMVEEKIDFDERLRLAKSFLYQISDFESFDLVMQDIFINLDQITISNSNLKFSNYIFLKSINREITQADMIKTIGHITETILELHREILTPELSAIQTYVYQLLHNELDLSYNDLYNRFKVLAAAYNHGSVNFTPNFEIENNASQILEQVRNQRLMRARHTSLETSSKLEEDESHEKREIDSTDTHADLKDELISEPSFSIEKGSVNLDEVMGEEKIILKEEEVRIVYQASEEVMSSTEEDKIYITEDEHLDLDQIIDAIKPDSDTQEPLDKFVIEEEDVDIKEVLDTFEDPIPTNTQDEDKIHIHKDDLMDDYILAHTQAINDSKSNEPSELSVEPDAAPDMDHIKEILNRNDKQHSDLSIEDKKQKKRFLPTFLLFFIILSLITSLLIFYSSTYM